MTILSICVSRKGIVIRADFLCRYIFSHKKDYRYASLVERQNWQLLGDGYAIAWTDLDEHIGIEGLLAGRRSGESQGALVSYTQHLQLMHQLAS